MTTPTLEALYAGPQTKVSDKWQSYLPVYDRVLADYRTRPIDLLEIGIQNGGSLDIWAQFFPHANHLIGCDIDPACGSLTFADPRIALVVGDANTDATAATISRHSDDFDIILDDGSHTSPDIIRSFAKYFPRLRTGGLYIIEDLHCSYWAEYGGGLFAPLSAMAFLRRLQDVVNFEHWGLDVARFSILNHFAESFDVVFPDHTLAQVHSVEMLNSLCIIQKKAAEQNILGRRVVTGSVAAICNDVLNARSSLLQRSQQPAAAALADPVLLEAALRSELASANRRIDELTHGEAALHHEVVELTDLNAALTHRVEQFIDSETDLHRRVAELTDLNAALTQRLAQLTDRESDLNRRVAELTENKDELTERIDALIRSSSWRITRPLRASVGLLRRDPAYIAEARSLLIGRTRQSAQVKSDPDPDPSSVADPSPDNAHFLEASRTVPPLGRREIPVDIIVCVHDALDDVRACLDAVLRNTMPPFSLVIVDDGSTEETRRWLEAFAARQGALLIRDDAAKGYNRAANTGLRATTAPWVVLLNSDTIPGEGWLDRLVEAGERDERIGLVGPLSNTASWQSVPVVQEGGGWASNPIPEGLTVQDVTGLVARVSIREGIPLPFLNGFCLGIRRRLINDIGIFDEESFGAGYGEENDYCIRARQHGWLLLVVEDAYVFHAQSNSYSHTRRTELARLAGEPLYAKHNPAQHIEEQVAQCRENLALAGVRGRIAEAIEWESQVAPRALQWEGKRVAFVLPVAFVGGETNVVIQEALALRELGIDCWIINFAEYRDAFATSYPDLNLPVLYGERDSGVAAACATLGIPFDAIIATCQSSVFSLPPADGTTQLAYYIQDFELLFHDPSDPRHSAAAHSYSVRPEIRMFTKTDWNANRVAEYAEMRPVVIGPSVDTTLFRPAPDASLTQEGPFQVCALVRPGDGTGRHSPELTLRVLQRLRAKFQNHIAITIFGASPVAMKAAGLQTDGIRALGELRPATMASLLKQTDIFLDLSGWPAMGLTALEAMATGCAVVVPRAGGAPSFATHEHNALVIETDSVDTWVKSASHLIREHDLRTRIRVQAAVDAAHFHPRRAALAMADVLFAASAAREGIA